MRMRRRHAASESCAGWKWIKFSIVTSQLPDEFLHALIALPKNGAECSPIHLAMIRNHCLGKRIVSAHDDMAAVLSYD